MKGVLMKRTNYLAVVAASVAAFATSSVWYTVFGNAVMDLSGLDPASAATPAGTTLFVIFQSAVVALVLAYFIARMEVAGWRDTALIGVLAWVFPAMILLGSVVHEDVPFGLAAIHAGDWLLKLLLMSLILGSWRGNGRKSRGIG